MREHLKLECPNCHAIIKERPISMVHIKNEIESSRYRCPHCKNEFDTDVDGKVIKNHFKGGWL